MRSSGSSFCGTRKFVSVYRRDRHWSPPWVSLIQLISSYPRCLTCTLMLFSCLLPRLKIGLFSSESPITCISNFWHTCYMTRLSTVPYFVTQTLFCEGYKDYYCAVFYNPPSSFLRVPSCLFSQTVSQCYIFTVGDQRPHNILFLLIYIRIVRKSHWTCDTFFSLRDGRV